MTKNKYKELFNKMISSFATSEDPIRSMLEWMTDQLMEAEVTSLKTIADKGLHSDERKTNRNGYRVRRWDTRVGTVYLTIPKVRQGGYQPFFLVHKQRSEASLMLLVREAYTNGVSTRKMQHLLSSMGVDNISSGSISNITAGLDEQVAAYKSRPLSAHYPVMWIDAVYEKIREDNKVINTAIFVAMAINQQGKREVLAIDTMDSESSENWQVFFNNLKNRGLATVDLIISDAHAGIKNAATKCFTGSVWQRCKVHFMRNILARINTKQKESVASDIKQIFTQDNIDDARTLAQTIIDRYQDKYADAMDILANGLEETLQFMNFPNISARYLSSTNHLERLNREIRRRSRVVGIFPSRDAYMRLICSYLMEYEEDWINDKALIQADKLELLCAFNKAA